MKSGIIRQYTDAYGVKVTVRSDMKDYSNEPVFLKKRAMAMDALQKSGLPKELDAILAKKKGVKDLPGK